jgi:hypothetical protein
LMIPHSSSPRLQRSKKEKLLTVPERTDHKVEQKNAKNLTENWETDFNLI